MREKIDIGAGDNKDNEMPNYVTTELYVEGAPAKIGWMVDLVAGSSWEENVFQQIVPMPKGMGMVEQVEWRAKNWGTQWDVSPRNVDLLESDVEFVRMVMLTATKQPSGIFEALTEMDGIDCVSAVWAEPAMGEVGDFHFSAERGVVENTYRISEGGEANKILSQLDFGDWIELEDVPRP